MQLFIFSDCGKKEVKVFLNITRYERWFYNSTRIDGSTFEVSGVVCSPRDVRYILLSTYTYHIHALCYRTQILFILL